MVAILFPRITFNDYLKVMIKKFFIEYFVISYSCSPAIVKAAVPISISAKFKLLIVIGNISFLREYFKIMNFWWSSFSCSILNLQILLLNFSFIKMHEITPCLHTLQELYLRNLQVGSHCLALLSQHYHSLFNSARKSKQWNTRFSAVQNKFTFP